MKPFLLRLTNIPILFFTACLLLAVQSSVFISFPLNWLQPDLLLPLVIWFGLKRGFTEGGILSLSMGYLAELHSSSPNGVLLTCYLTIFLVARLTARLLVIPNRYAWIHFTILASIVWKATGLIVLAALGKIETQWLQTLFHLLPCAAITGLTSIAIYRFLRQLDRLTYKNSQIQRQLSDDMNLMENEGI